MSLFTANPVEPHWAPKASCDCAFCYCLDSNLTIKFQKLQLQTAAAQGVTVDWGPWTASQCQETKHGSIAASSLFVYWLSSTPFLFQRAEIVPTCPSPQPLLQAGEMGKLREDSQNPNHFLCCYKTIRQHKGSAVPAKLV